MEDWEAWEGPETVCCTVAGAVGCRGSGEFHPEDNMSSSSAALTSALPLVAVMLAMIHVTGSVEERRGR